MLEHTQLGEISMDPEILAMSKVAEALEELDEPARSRILKWASDRFQITTSLPIPPEEAASSPAGRDSEESRASNGYDTFAELFADASPSSHAERVLVAGYWHQVVQGQNDLSSSVLNKDLKDLGYAVANISEKFDSLMSTKPQLAIQLKKSGNSKQARKKYKITKAGIDKVNQMLGGSN